LCELKEIAKEIDDEYSSWKTYCILN
jgi:hypothetical protein